MRTNIDIDDTLLAAAMRAGGYTTKKDAVEAGLKLLARQAAYQDILRLRGRLRWDDDTLPSAVDADAALAEPPAGHGTAAAPPTRARRRRTP